MPIGWNIVCEDESIVIYDSIVRKVWAVKGSKPAITVTGQHRKTCLFGAISIDGKQLFRQNKKIDTTSFLQFLKLMKRKFKRFILFIDKASWHKSKEVDRYLEKYKEIIKIRWFPTCSPELNPVEECWRQTKDSVVGSVFYESFDSMKKEFSKYLRLKRFKLDIVNYLCR